MRMLILGATSAIARATAHEYAAHGAELYLASRDVEELARIAADLIIRYRIKVHYAPFDAEAFATHETFLQKVIADMQTLDTVLVAFGYLGASKTTTQSSDALAIINRNFTGAVSIINYCADYFAAQKRGQIIGISSVAGDRGRQSNYIYGASKAGLTTYLQGLRNRLYPLGVQVLTVKPGLVDTPMTLELPHKPFMVGPEYVGKRIFRAATKNKNVVYIPWFWRYIMLIVKLIPESIFKRLRF